MLGLNYMAWLGLLVWVVVPRFAVLATVLLWRRAGAGLTRALALVVGFAIVLIGGAGNDHMSGGAGDDTYLDVTGNDTVYDVEGNNTIVFATATGLGTGGLSTSTFTAGDGSTGLQLNIALDNGETLNNEWRIAA